MTSATSVHGFPRSAARVLEAASLMPGGVGSDFRLGISPTPLVIERAEGPYLYDVDGHRLIDYYLGMGPMILGHLPPLVVQAVIKQLATGILLAAQTEVEYEAARLVTEMVPCADLVRFASSGTEAIQAALRVSRAATGRTKIVAFEGHYHGWLDNVAWARDKSDGTLLPVSRGQDTSTVGSIELLDWNNAELVVERVGSGDVAAVLMEPSMCNSSAIHPAPGYLEAVRAACSDTGTVLIFDEVITGFRVGPGGAQRELGVTPDLAAFGKAIASGFPVACLAGRGDLMGLIGGPGHVVHAGTYNGQAVGMAATVATLQTLRDGSVHRYINVQGTTLRDGITALLLDHGLPARVQGWPAIFHVSFGESEVITNFRAMRNEDKQLYRTFTSLLLERGVRALERGAWFLSSTHDDEVVASTLAAVDSSLHALTTQ